MGLAGKMPSSIFEMLNPKCRYQQLGERVDTREKNGAEGGHMEPQG